MNQTQIDRLIEELVGLDPSFAAHRESLRKILTELSQTKENIEISEQFVSTLRTQVLAAHTPLQTHTSFIQQLFHTMHMNTKQITLGSAGVLATLAIVVGAYAFFDRTSPIQYVPQPVEDLTLEEQTLALGPNAFGSLGSVQLGNITLPPGAEAFVSSRSAVSSDTTAAASIALGGESISAVEPAVDKMMIMPWFQFDYVYVGEELELPTELSVYRRLLSNKIASSAATALRSVNNGIISLPSGLVAEQVSVRTAGNTGYSYQFDFANEQVSLYEQQSTEYIDNWNSRNALPEVQLVQIASDFLADQGVSIEAYGTPIIDRLYMKYAENGSEIPQFLTVIFPLMTPSGEIVYTQNGELPAGIGVTVDQARNKVTSVWNIKRAVFESSAYALTTDAARVLTVATQGGSVSAPWYSEEAERAVLELGTPVVVYTEYYRYNEATQKNEELYIPSLRFPVVSEPTIDVYYSPTYVTVPLVAELLVEPEYEVGVPMPRPMPIEPYDAPATSESLR